MMFRLDKRHLIAKELEFGMLELEDSHECRLSCVGTQSA